MQIFLLEKEIHEGRHPRHRLRWPFQHSPPSAQHNEVVALDIAAEKVNYGPPIVLTRFKDLLDRVATHEGFHRYFANSSWMLAEQVVRLIAGVFVGIWVARHLGPGPFGILNYAVAFVAIFGSIAKLGLDEIVVRELVQQPDKADLYLGTAFWLKVAGGVIAMFAVTVATLLTTNDSITNLFIFIIASGLVLQSFDVIDFYFQSRVLSKFVSICKFVQLFFSSLLKIYLILSEAELVWFVLVALIDQLTLAIALNIAYKSQRHTTFYRKFDLAVAKFYLVNNWPLIFSGLVIMIYMRIDQIMIKEMLGVREVGIYAAATRLSEVWYFIPMAITSSLFPAIVNAKKISKELYQLRLQSLYSFMIWLAIAIAIPTTFLNDWLVTTLYGEMYKDAGQVVMVQIWAGIFVFLGVASNSWLINENLQKYAFYRILAGAIINIALNLVLIPEYGVVGAAVATVITQATVAFISDIFFEKTRVAFYMKLKAINIKYLMDGGNG